MTNGRFVLFVSLVLGTVQAFVLQGCATARVPEPKVAMVTLDELETEKARAENCEVELTDAGAQILQTANDAAVLQDRINNYLANKKCKCTHRHLLKGESIAR